MNAAVARTKVESLLARRFDRVFERHERKPGELFPTGVADIDRCGYGLPRGAITEIHGSRSCGRTSLLLSVLSRATAQEETCALVDCSDTFDLLSATKAGVDFDRVLWVRCSNNLERGFKSVDLLLHGGGFGFIALLLGDVPAKAARRIISSWWFRFRRAVEHTPTVLMVITPIACIRSCAALTLELKKETAVWPGSLSLVSENSNGALTGKDHHLTLVRTPPAESRPLSHSLWLQKISIHINRQRPVQWSDGACQFEPELALTMFEDIR